MSRRANKTTISGDFRFEGIAYAGPVDLFRSMQPRPVLRLSTFACRMSRLSRAGALTDDAIREALYLPPDVYMQKYRARKTWVKVAESKLDLESFYRAAESRARVSYRTFWSRVRAAKKRDHLNTETLDDALTLESADWVSFYGGGRHRRFVYRGELYPEHQQKAFHGIAAFLKTIGRYAEKSRIWSRMKAGWDLDMALSVPVDIRTERRGIIYKLTRIRTGQVYIGLTLGSLDQRWMLHVNSARTGAQTRLAKAIRSDGAEGFSREVIEEDIGDTRTLKAREIFFAAHFKALGPRGLNTAKPGSLSTPSGKKTEFEGEVFRSVTEAAQVLAERTGLAPHVIEARLRTGRSLPKKARKHSKHPDAGSSLFRRWLALRRRHPGGIDPAWEDSYDAFRSGVGPSFRSGLELIRKDNSQAWGPANFEWVTAQQKIENFHGKAIRINGIDYPSLRTVAESFGIGLSTLKDRLRRQGLSPEQAVAMPLGATSYRHSRERIAVDGNRFRSKRQAILYIARTRRITEHQAKHRVRRGDFL